MSALTISCSNPPVGYASATAAYGVPPYGLSPYAHAFPASGGVPPYSFSFLNLATGGLSQILAIFPLTLDPATGIISGNPVNVDIEFFVVQVTDSLGATATVRCSISTYPPVQISCSSPPAGTAGAAYSHLFPARFGLGPYAFSITAGTLPPGLSLNAATGVVSGTPSSAGTYSFTIGVTDNPSLVPAPGGWPPPNLSQTTAGTGCSIVVAAGPPPPSIRCGGPSAGVVGAAYSHAFPISGLTPPYTFVIASGSLPPGLTLDTSTGVVTGVPTETGVFPFTISVTGS